MAAVNSATSVRKMSNALAAHPVVSGILALVSSHREVLEFNCLPRGKVGEAWQLEDSAFLLDFLLEACSDKALKRRTFGALRAMERSSARRIQTWWRGKAHCPPEVPQCASRFEVRSEEISDPFPEVKESSEASSQPRVQILILDTPSPEVYTDMPAVRLDLAEDKPAAVDTAEPLMQRPLANQVNTELHAEVPAEETPEDALEAPANQALAETEMKPEEEGSEQERLQALWLQLQQGQREWQQRQAGVEGELTAPKAPKAPVTSYPTAPAQPAPPRPSVRLADSSEEAPRRPAALAALPVTTDLVLAGPTGHSTPGSSPGGLDLSKGKVAAKGEHMYRRKWNPRIAMEQRKEREKQWPAANPPRPAPASGAPQARGEDEVKHCSHDDPMAAECGSASTAGLSLGNPADIGPDPKVGPEPVMKAPASEALGPARLNRHPPNEDPGLEDLDFARLQKMISDTMASADAEIAGSEVGAADAGASRSAGLSLGAPGPPRKMANIRAAAEHRRQQSSQREPPAEESAELADDVANSWLRSSDAEKPRQTDIRAIAERRAAGFRSAAPGGSRTPGSATRTPTPRGGVYKPSHLYSGRGAAAEKPESAF